MKKTIAFILVLLALAAIAPAALADGGEALPPVTAALSPFSAENGEIAVPLGTSGDELLACFEDKAELTLAAADGSALSPTDDVASGALVSRGGERVTVIVPGDVTGDAKINVRDAIAAMKVALGSTDGVFASAADVNADGSTNGRDVIRLMRSLVGWNETLGAERAPAEADDPALTMYFTSSMLRVERGDSAIHGTPDGVIRMAKNETEDAHIILISTEKKTDLTLDIGEIANADGAVLDREVRYGYYYSSSMFTEGLHESREKQDFNAYVDSGYYSDPYPALSGAFNVGANENQSFIVKVKTTADSFAGWYSAPVRVRDSEGNEIKRATLWVYVWDFTLDVTPACRTLFGFTMASLTGYYQRYEIYDPAVHGSWDDIYENWYNYLLENRISVYGLPKNKKTQYMDDPRVTAFVSARGSNIADSWDNESYVNQVKSTYATISQKEEWLYKAYIYSVDEPWGAQGAEYVKKQWNCAKAALGDIPFKTILPIGNNSYISDSKTDILAETWDYCNAFCPQSSCFTPMAAKRDRKANKQAYPEWGEYMEEAQFKNFGQFRPRYEALRERGDDMWWYICIGPMPPYANWWYAQQGAVNRAVLWQQYFYDIDGILYWDVAFWQLGETNSKRINLTRMNNGDGLLVYDGDLWGEGITPVPSIRFEAVRDGIEDFQYLRQLERELGRDAAMEYTTRVTTDILDYSDDWRDIDGARNEMGFALEKLGSEN